MPHPSGTDSPYPLGGAPELGDVERVSVDRARTWYASAVGNYSPPLSAGYWGVIPQVLGGVIFPGIPSGFTPLPADFPRPTATAPYSPPPLSPSPPKAEYPFTTLSGIGGGNLVLDGFELTRLYLRLAACQLHLAGTETLPSSAHALISSSMESFGGAINAARQWFVP